MKNKRRECKRAAAMLLAALMVVNSIDLSVFTAYAAQSENSNVMTITGFEELEEGYEASVTIDGETQNYATLEEAFSAAEGKTATITMLNDAECISTDGSPLNVNNSNSNITLDMNGKTLSGNGNSTNGIIDVKNGSLFVQGSGKVASTNIGLSTESGNGKLTVEDITVDVSSGDSGFYIGTGTVTLNNVQITGQAENQAVYLCGGDTTLNNVSVTESDVYYYSKGTLKINSGSFAKISVKDGNGGNIKTVLRFLGNGCSYRYMDEDKTWATSGLATTLEISNVTVEKIPLTINPQAETSWYYNSDEHSLQMNAVPTTESNAITYEWYDGDTNLECDSDVYTIPKTMPAGNYGYTCKATCDGYTLSKYFSFEIKQAVTALDDIKSYNGDTETDKFFVDDTITVKATLDVAGESPVSSMRNSARVEAPASGQMALFIDDTQVSEAADAGTDGSYTMEVSAFDVLSQRGYEPNSTAITLTAKYIGDSNLSDAEGTVEVNISAYATVTWSKASETVYYTGNAISSDNISTFLKVTGASDTDITSYYDTADYTFSYRTYQFGIGGSNAGGLGLPSTASFEDGLPTEIGTYQIKATVKEKGNYHDAETTEYLTLTVDWFDSVQNADLYDQNRNNVSSGTEYWTQSITFTAPTGFTISQELNGTYTSSFTYQEETGKGGTAVTYYLKEDGSGCIAKKTATIYIDRTSPTFPESGDYGIQIKENWFKSLLNTITFGLVYQNNVEVKVCAKEDLSGIKEYYYYIDESGTVKTVEDLNALKDSSGFTAIDKGGFINTLQNNNDTKNYVVYAYAVDQAGNRSDYICSNCVVVDDKKPTITLTAPTEDDGTLTDSSATITLNASEAGTYFYVLKKDGEAVPSAMADFADSATDNGKTIWTAETGIESASMVEGDNTITLTGLDANTEYTLYVVAADSVGNTAETVESKAFTTLKQVPTITVNPQITGTYGQKLSEMTVTDGTASYNNNTVTGTWKITEANAGDIYPIVNGTTKYKVTFTPTDTTTYEIVTADVVPTVAKKSVTVMAEDKTKTYGEVNPELTLEVPDGTLVGSDIKADLGVTLSCEAGQYSDVKAGGYTITGTSDSANYHVTVTPGTLTIEKADAQINVPKSSYEVTYGDAPFNLDITDTNLDEAVEYEVTAGADLIAVSGDGTVTIKSAKNENAAIKVTLPESTNYNAAPEQTINITVAKKTYGTGSNDITKKYLCSRDNADTIDISALLPTDCGTVTYTVTMKEGSYKVEPAVDTDGNLTYTVLAGSKGDTGKFVIKAETDNYEDITIMVSWELTDKIPVELQEGSSVTLKNSVLTYGDALSELRFNEAVFVSQDDPTKEITGTLAWTNPSRTPDAGTTSAEWTFTPDASYSEEYDTVTDYANITVNKAVPTVETAPAVDMTYNPNTALSGIDLNTAGTTVTAGTVKGAGGSILSGSWNWNASSQIPQVNNNGYVATFTPTDMTNYEPVDYTITVTVAKATPYIDGTPTASGLTYGQTLADSTVQGNVYYDSTKLTQVAGNFVWENESTKPTVKTDSDTTKYTVIFKPTDSSNYNEKGVQITITVAKAQYAPNMPGNTKSVVFSCKTVGAVSLPEGWVWGSYQDGDETTDQTTALDVGIPVKAVAVYNGADEGNYINESVVITITRSACEHVAGEIIYTGIGEHAPNCENTGLGHRECTKCHEVTESGIVVAALGHKGGTATCTKKAVCTVCRQEYGSTNPDNHAATEVRGHKNEDCTSAGYTGDTHCADCGMKLRSGTVIAALGHKYKSVETTAPTTTSTGVRTYTCERCGDSYTETIAKLPEEAHKHSYTATITGQADCINAGVKTYTCSCGDSYTESIPSMGHYYVSRVTKEATATEEGIMTYTCDRCGHSYTRPIAKLESNKPDNNKPGSNEPDNNKPGNDNKPDDNSKPDDSSKPETGKPYIEGREDENGWENIKDQLEIAKDKNTITVEMNGTTTVPGDIFDIIKGKDISVIFDMGDGIYWKVNGKNITNEMIGDIDFGVKVGSQAGNTIPMECINKVTGERYSINLTLSYDGEFGFTANLTLNAGKENAGLYANLFYYNPKKNELEYICADKIDEEGNANLSFTHASDYIIVVDTEDMKNTDIGSASDVSTVPGTADVNDAWNPWWIIVIGAVILIVEIGVFFLVKKKREKKESDN